MIEAWERTAAITFKEDWEILCSCPTCDTYYITGRENLGKEGECKKCKKVFQIEQKELTEGEARKKGLPKFLMKRGLPALSELFKAIDEIKADPVEISHDDDL
jgi:transposase-like protein